MKTIKAGPAERRKLLSGCGLLAGLDATGQEALAAVMFLRAYDPGEILLGQDQPAEGFFVLVRGSVKVLRTGRDGREQVLHVFSAGELCGEVPVFQGRRYPASAVAVGRVRALYVPADRFLEIAEQNPHILLEMLAVLSQRLRRFVDLIDDLSLKEVSARLAKHLLDLRVRAGRDAVELDTAKAVLAARLGTTAETLSRTLKKMQTRRVIAVGGRRIDILDGEALAVLAAGEKL